jgi:hypothetical protein
VVAADPDAEDSSEVNFAVMAGLVPAIHVFTSSGKKDVDARHKAGHDGANFRRNRQSELDNHAQQ